MADYYDEITPEQELLIRQAPLFFVASAAPGLEHGPHGAGPVNVSPKGGVPLHIIDSHRVAYLDYAGSGNETARHSSEGGPITVMVCSFDENAAIVRLYGRARVLPLAESVLAGRLRETPAADLALPERQVIEIDVERTSTSCGYGVPVMTLEKERTVAERGRRYKAPRKHDRA